MQHKERLDLDGAAAGPGRSPRLGSCRDARIAVSSQSAADTRSSLKAGPISLEDVGATGGCYGFRLATLPTTSKA